MISRLTEPLHHLLSTLHDSRYRLPRKTRFRLAGCAFAGRESNPLGHGERFQSVHVILLSRAYPVASWSHCRRLYEQAKESDPHAGASALALIGGLYSIERDIRRARVEGAAKRAIRESQSAPIAKEFFAWCRKQCERADLLPRSPLAKALRYTLDREEGLSVFLADPCVAIDTNHL